MIILASNSPRRKELLELAGVDFKVKSSNVEEVYNDITDTAEIAMYLADIKAKDVYTKYSNNEDIVIGADTVVSIDGKIFGKPKTKTEARNMLKSLSNRVHSVITGVSIITNNKVIKFYSESFVHFYELSDEEIENYISTDEPFDKAGSYGIQGKGFKFVSKIDGDFYSIMGLPISKVVRYLENL